MQKALNRPFLRKKVRFRAVLRKKDAITFFNSRPCEEAGFLPLKQASRLSDSRLTSATPSVTWV